jgi:predicted Rdx family selenoprotein
MNCHGSANLDLAIPNWVPPERDETADNAANRGTRMHEMFAEIMCLSAKDAAMMAKAIDYVAAWRGRRRFRVLIEESVQATWLVRAPWTTADLVLHVQDELHIFDLKTGTIPVSAVENDQLLYYAMTYGPLAPKAKGVYLHIVQPWASNIEVWFADAARLAVFKAEALATERAILAGDTTLVPGDHCQFCPANPHGRGARGKPACPAMLQLLYPRVAVDEDAMFKED